MNTTIKRIIFLFFILFIIYINYKLNNIFKTSYINCIKYFFIILGIILMVFPNFDKDYQKIKSNLSSKAINHQL